MSERIPANPEFNTDTAETWREGGETILAIEEMIEQYGGDDVTPAIEQNPKLPIELVQIADGYNRQNRRPGIVTATYPTPLRGSIDPTQPLRGLMILRDGGTGEVLNVTAKVSDLSPEQDDATGGYIPIQERTFSLSLLGKDRASSTDENGRLLAQATAVEAVPEIPEARREYEATVGDLQGLQETISEARADERARRAERAHAELIREQGQQEERLKIKRTTRLMRMGGVAAAAYLGVASYLAAPGIGERVHEMQDRVSSYTDAIKENMNVDMPPIIVESNE